ncbi:hypothetical protein GQX74_008495 [Glossina fuscipes]|nr:hypothetical protein GQX74_008495 [Glossina fuscipes]
MYNIMIDTEIQFFHSRLLICSAPCVISGSIKGIGELIALNSRSNISKSLSILLEHSCRLRIELVAFVVIVVDIVVPVVVDVIVVAVNVFAKEADVDEWLSQEEFSLIIIFILQ